MADDLFAVARDRARSNRFWQHLGILATVNPESAGGVGQTTLDLNVTYLAAARGPAIHAEGMLLRRGRTVAFGEVRVTDDAGALVAVGRATYLILPSRAREASG